MRVLRGRAGTVEADREVTRSLLADVRRDGEAEEDEASEENEVGESAVRAWRPHRQVAFGRRDAASDGYDRAREVAREHGFPPHERGVGGRAVAYTGATVAFARIEPIGDTRTGIRDRYSRTTTDVQVALSRLGVHARPGEPDGAFCPGSHSLRAEGKIVGIAQRVQRGVSLTAGIVITRDHADIAGVLDPVYGALDVPFDPDAVGSVARAGGNDDPETVARTLERALVGDPAGKVRVEQVRSD